MHLDLSSAYHGMYQGGTAAAISKTAAAPIERVKLLIQNQGAMLAAGRLDKPYTGIVDCFKRTYADEGMKAVGYGSVSKPLTLTLVPVLQGQWWADPNLMCYTLDLTWISGTNVIRYFPTQALNFAFKGRCYGITMNKQLTRDIDTYKKMFGFKKAEGYGLWVAGQQVPPTISIILLKCQHQATLLAVLPQVPRLRSLCTPWIMRAHVSLQTPSRSKPAEGVNLMA